MDCGHDIVKLCRDEGNIVSGVMFVTKNLFAEMKAASLVEIESFGCCQFLMRSNLSTAIEDA